MKSSQKKIILSLIWGPLLVTQFILAFVFGMYNQAELDILLYAGWLIWGISLILAWIPIFTLKRKGGVGKRESYVNTTVLVDTGIYSIARHPQYTAGILFSLALVLISQSWLVLAIGIIVISLSFIDITIADKYEIEKFGDDYRSYMKKVPRTDFLLGIIRLLRRRNIERKRQVTNRKTYE